jgi:hypothetical protein
MEGVVLWLLSSWRDEVVLLRNVMSLLDQVGRPLAGAPVLDAHRLEYSGYYQLFDRNYSHKLDSCGLLE